MLLSFLLDGKRRPFDELELNLKLTKGERLANLMLLLPTWNLGRTKRPNAIRNLEFNIKYNRTPT